MPVAQYRTVAEAYHALKSAKAASEALGIPYATVRYVLRDNGINVVSGRRKRKISKSKREKIRRRRTWLAISRLRRLGMTEHASIAKELRMTERRVINVTRHYIGQKLRRTL